MHRLAIVLAALWWGGITGMSFVAVPTLFAKLGNPAAAGPVAAQLFSFQCYAGLIIGIGLLMLLRQERAQPHVRSHDMMSEAAAADVARMQRGLATMGFVLLGMLLALVQEFGVAHKIVTARASGGDLRFWHGVGSLLVLGQWLCAGSVLWRLSRAAHR
ncbi:MAG: DUF4149 domain-containing protein [Gammaproteobacteria bacterium]